MSTSRALIRLRRTIADLANPSSVNYFILIHRECMQFVRLAGRRLTVPIESQRLTSEGPDVVAFCSQVVESPFYYGQAIGLLMNGHRSFSFMKRYANAQAARIRDDLKALSMDGMAVNHVLRTGKESTLVVAQGIENEFLQSTFKQCQQSGLNLLYVSTLPAYLVLHTRLLDKSSNSLIEFNWSATGIEFLAIKADGTAHYSSTGPSEGETAAERQHVISLVYGNDNGPTILRFAVKPKKDEKPIAILFRRGHNVSRQDQALFRKSPASRLARATMVTSNSFKLLSNILGAALVVLLVVWLIYRPSDTPVSANEEKYQTAYSDNLQLQRTADSLDAVPHRDIPRRTLYNPAAVFSLFCQERVAGLWLNGLSLKRFGSDSLVVEAAGMARSSQTVFSYQSEVSGLTKSLPLNLLSLHPEVVASSGQPDTVVSFKLGATVHETSQTE